MSFSSFLAMTDHFIQAQDKSSFNVKVILDVKNQDVYLFESPSSYPEKSLYESGVHTELMKHLKVDALPHFFVYKKGQLVWQQQGIVSLEELKAKIR